MSTEGVGIYFLGFGGHARSVADVALAVGVNDMIFVDARARPGETFAGFATLTSLPVPLAAGWTLFPAMGENLARKAAFGHHDHMPPKLISPTATIGILAEVGPGTLVGHHAHIGPAAVIGRGVIINTGAVVEHECQVGDFSHISVNATVAGRTRIGSNVFVGAGATVIDKISICDDVIVGAGATVVDHILTPGTYVGTPARLLDRVF